MQANNVSFEIPPNWIRNLKILHVGMCMGVLFFAIVPVLLFFIGQSESNSSGDVVQILFYVLIVQVIIFTGIFRFLFHFQRENTILRKMVRQHLETYHRDPSRLMTIFQKFFIIRMGLLEGGALFGIVILLLSVIRLDISLYTQLTMVVVTILFVIMIFQYPSEEKIRHIIENILIPIVDEEKVKPS